jgi:fatty acid kinase fatty acid binding subunit
MGITLVTDSASNVPSSLAAELGIQIVPMYLKFGEIVYRDGVDLPPGDFYERLASEQVAVSTAGASVGDFAEAFETALRTAEGVVCVTVASFVSVTHSSAVKAAEDFGGRVVVVDSASASMGEGFSVVEGARAAAAGAALEEVAARAQDVASRTELAATINTFEYLRRSGRVHALLAYAGAALNIKPVFAFRGGKVEQLGRPRSRSRAVERVVEEIAQVADRGPVRLAVCHAAVAEEAEALRERLVAELSPDEALINEFTPLMGAHTGPGLLGVAAWA